MNMLYRYFLVVAACAALLLGIQLPNFVDQYEKRLDAHLSEVSINLQGYQDIADKFFGGSLADLITKHEQSLDIIFREEAKPIRVMFQRQRHFLDEKSALATGLLGKLIHLASRGDEQLLDETYASYSYTVPLNGAALTAGMVAMIGTVLFIELLRLLMRRLFASSKPASRPAG